MTSTNVTQANEQADPTRDLNLEEEQRSRQLGSLIVPAVASLERLERVHAIF
jgi:hypothetical protein